MIEEETADELLYQVLIICRGKTSKPLQTWMALKSNIYNYLNKKGPVSISSNDICCRCRGLSSINERETTIKLHEKISRLQNSVNNQKNIVLKYQKREADIKKVIKGNPL